MGGRVVLRTMAGIPSEFGLKLSREAINLLPVKRWQGTVSLAKTDSQLEKAVERLMREKVLGFDMETKPAFRKGVTHQPALVQLAGVEEIVLFQLNNLENFDSLAKLLSCSEILKVGVGLEFDVKRLQTVFPFQPQGFFDVGDEARRLGIESHGLRNLTARFFKFRISKRAQCSNWENQSLKPFQIHYAATDAWVSREIYFAMKTRRFLSEDPEAGA